MKMGMASPGLSYWQAESEGIELLNVTVGDFFDLRAAEVPEREAVVYSGYPELADDGELRWTYAEYRARVDAVAKGLLALGLKPGDHIAVWAINRPEWLLLELAAAKTGLVLVTINPVYRQGEVEYALKQSDVKALFFMAQVRDHDCLATVRALVTPGVVNGVVRGEQLPELCYVALLGPAPAGFHEQTAWRPATFDEVIAGGAAIADEQLRARQDAVQPADPLLLIYTSGTTGFPKGAVLTHYGLVNAARVEYLTAGAVDGDRYLFPFPLFHVTGTVAAVAAVAFRMTLFPLLSFDALKALQIIQRERCTLMVAVTTMLLAMLQHREFETYRPRTLRLVVSGGAPVPVTLMGQVKERMGSDVGIGFGQTESCGGGTFTRLSDSFERKSATVGFAAPHTDVKVIDPTTGATVPCGKRGELCLRGVLVMAGYYKMPEKTAEAIDAEGWLHTGDLATIDAEGYVNIVGRLKDMVIRGGENIFPREIEEVLIRHPKVADVQVVGVPDAFFGEELLAAVQLRAGEAATEQELRDFCRERISHQKVPRYVQFVTSFPMTPSGKVQKFRLREEAIRLIGLEEVAAVRTA
jgi:fatty-acyl-CoA synthase